MARLWYADLPTTAYHTRTGHRSFEGDTRRRVLLWAENGLRLSMGVSENGGIVHPQLWQS
jgi:hypothetical protein